MQVRLVPMSRQDLEMKDKTIFEIQNSFFENYLKSDSGSYSFKTAIKANKGDLFLFQFEGQIIASAILDRIIKFDAEDKDGYRGKYFFNPNTIRTFNPINSEEFKKYASNFNGFNQSPQYINIINFSDLINRTNQYDINNKKVYSYEILERLGIPDNEIMNYKVRLLVQNSDGSDPLKIFKQNNSIQEWVAWKYDQDILNRPRVISFVKNYEVGNDYWLYVGTYEVTKKDNFNSLKNCVGYDVKSVGNVKDIGLLNIKFKNDSQQMIRNLENVVVSFSIPNMFESNLTLNDIVKNEIISIHMDTNQEWIPLKNIYSKIQNKYDSIKKISDATIRDTLEKRCKLSMKYNGTEEYILKEKNSGLYKSIYYEQLKFINGLNIGDVFTRKQLMKIFKISGQSGIMKTNTLNCLVLTTSEENGVYDDSTVQNGLITYTGEGLVGDQQLIRNNKTILESKENGLPMFLFSKDKNRNYIFEGRVELCDEPFQVQEKDINGDSRLVWKFPLKIIYPDNYNFEEDEKFKEIVYEIAEIENKIEDDNKDNNELEFREGKVNIRKYRKTDRKINRSSKPDYIAEEIIKNMQGIINEKLIYENELKRLMQEEADEQVKQMEEFFNNKKDNEGYDILSFELDEFGNYIEKYIEVKSTKGNEGTPIDITSDEVDFAKKHIDNYYLYRIINSDSKNRYLKIIKGRDLFENNDYNFVPTSYKIYSN